LLWNVELKYYSVTVGMITVQSAEKAFLPKSILIYVSGIESSH
jgi:hypothetical protein